MAGNCRIIDEKKWKRAMHCQIFRNSMADMPNALNAGVDVNHFEPVNFLELVKNNKNFKAEYIRGDIS